MRPLQPLLLAVLLTSTAAAAPFGTVAGDEASLGKPLSTLNTGLGFIDANGNGRADVSEPGEPVYLDVDGSRSATYGDLRLTAALGYAAGTSVDVLNADAGHVLATPGGWFSTTPAGAWIVDLDGDRTVSLGDLRMAPFGGRVVASDADLRAPLQAAQQQVTSSARVGYVDLDGDRARDAAEPVYLDLDPSGTPGNGQVSNGDLRLAASGPGLEPDTPTRAEFEAALSEAGVETGADGSFARDQASAWDTPTVLALVLGLANLVGLVYVVGQVRKAREPRHPGGGL